LAAYGFLAARRREQEMAQLLGVVSLGTNGDGEKVSKQIEQWIDQ
jgi:hypothetical protein